MRLTDDPIGNEQTAINAGDTPIPSSEPILKMLYRLKYHALCIFTNKACNVFVLSFFSILPHTTIQVRQRRRSIQESFISTHRSFNRSYRTSSPTFAITCDTIGIESFLS